MTANGREVLGLALSSLGKGFDLTSDFRFKFCKGKKRLVLLSEENTRELAVPGFGTIGGVPLDVKCDKGDRTRFQSDILDFKQMSEALNQRSSVPGKIPSGLFNAMFGFQSDSWAADAANTRYLGLDGYFITLFNLHIDRYPLVLADEVLHAVPSTWDPFALARFIEKYGTHIIVGLSVGGQDAVLVRQDRFSNVGPAELKKNLDDLANQLFSGACAFTPLHSKTRAQKHKIPRAFNLFDTQPATPSSFSFATWKDGITVGCFRRGGEPSGSSHSEWLLTVPEMPDAINFNFIPITSLLKDVPGKGFLSHAINLYLRYKPPITELPYFLDFQAHKIWAPIHNEHPLGPVTNKGRNLPALSFNLMGPKLYINTTRVEVERRPVTGMRLYLEGKKCNRLAVHLQHLLNAPLMLRDKISDVSFWRGSENIGDSRYFEAVNGKRFSHISTASVRFDPSWTNDRKDLAFIVTGAQLHVKQDASKKILHLRLLFTKVSRCVVVQSHWAQCSTELSHSSGIFSAISASLSGNPVKEKGPAVVVDSSVFPDGPPVPVQAQKLLKFVDTAQICKGPQDSPGHWLVTGAKLELEKGKICLHVKFSLLNMLITGEECANL